MRYTKADYPAPARLMHTINLLCLLALGATGFFIHKPTFSLLGVTMNTARYIHVIAGFMIALNLFYRFYWSIFGGPRDITSFLPDKENSGKLFPLISYYLFMRKTQPKTAKYNPMQKATYNFWFFLIIFQAIIGFALLWKTNPMLASVIDALGGLMMVKAIHYLTMWVFIVTVMIHVYMVVSEDIKSVMLMFFGIEPGA